MGGLILHGLVPSGAGTPEEAPPHMRIVAGPLTGLATGFKEHPDLDDPEVTLLMAGVHNSILVAYAAMGDVLPVRLGACFSGEPALSDHLERDAQPLLASLHRIAGKAEYALRVDVSGDAEPVPPSASGGGRAYLMAKRADHAARRTRSETRRELAETIRSTAVDLACAHHSLPCRQGDRLLDLALLLPKFAPEDLSARLQPLAECAAGQGLRLRLTGPCPPYSFSHQETELADA